MPPCRPRVRSAISSSAARNWPRFLLRSDAEKPSHAAWPHKWGARVSRCAPLPLPSARPSRMFEQNQQCSSLATSLFSSLRSNSEILTCCCRSRKFHPGGFARSWRNLFLRHQLNVALRRAPHRLRLRNSDRGPHRLDDAALAKPAQIVPRGSARHDSAVAIAQGFGPIGAGNPALDREDPRLTGSCGN
jgi:hypothetical protein